VTAVVASAWFRRDFFVGRWLWQVTIKASEQDPEEDASAPQPARQCVVRSRAGVGRASTRGEAERPGPSPTPPRAKVMNKK